jgi:hypothetical protein
MIPRCSEHPDCGSLHWHTDEVAEVSLLVPARQAATLVALALSRQVSVGELLRGLINTSLSKLENGNGNQDRGKTNFSHVAGR